MNHPPMTSPQLDQLRQVIIKANPEIVELQRGCVVEVESYLGGVFTRRKTVSGVSNKGDLYLTGGMSPNLYARESVTRVIGRDITLEDVLRTMQGNPKAPIGVDINGYFLECEDDLTDLRLMFQRWTLGKPLQDQPPSTISFLHSLIVGDKD